MTKMEKRPVGQVVDPLPAGNRPDQRPLHGRWIWLEPVAAAKHAEDLFASFTENDPKGHLWTYLGYGPFESLEVFTEWLKGREESRDPWFYAFIRRDTGKACGMGAFMRCDAANGAIEIGHIWMAPGLQRTREATEVDLSNDPPLLRRSRCSAAGMEMRCVECALATGGGTFRLHLRRNFPPAL